MNVTSEHYQERPVRLLTVLSGDGATEQILMEEGDTVVTSSDGWMVVDLMPGKHRLRREEYRFQLAHVTGYHIIHSRMRDRVDPPPSSRAGTSVA